MDRSPQEPAPQPEGAESPLSFPVEAPRPAGLEPGAGAPTTFSTEIGPALPADPLAFPAEAAPTGGAHLFPPEAAARPADPLAFPAEAAPTVSAPLFPPSAAAPPASPLAFPAEVASPAGSPLFPPEATARPADPLNFPAEAAPTGDAHLFPPEAAARPATPPLTDPPLFPAEATTAPPHGEPLPFPVAEIPGAPAAPPPTPAAEPEPEPEPAPIFPGLLRLLPPLLAALAALLAVGGCFLPLFRMVQDLDFRQGFPDAQLTITETAWGNRIEISGQQATDRPGTPVGITVIVAIVLLAVAAFAASSRPDRGLTRWLLSAGAVFTTGVVATIGMGRFELAAIAGEEVNLEVTTAAGMWLLVLATVLAAGAAVLAHLPRTPGRTPGWADPAVAYADTPTPPSGVAITVLPPRTPLP